MDDKDKHAAELAALWGALAIGAALQIASGADPTAVIAIAVFFGFLFSPRE